MKKAKQSLVLFLLVILICLFGLYIYLNNDNHYNFIEKMDESKTDDSKTDDSNTDCSRCQPSTGWCLLPDGQCIGSVKADNQFDTTYTKNNECTHFSIKDNCIKNGGKWCKPDLPKNIPSTCGTCYISINDKNEEVLNCRCKRTAATPIDSTLTNFRSCKDIENMEGLLTCMDEKSN